MKKQSLKKVFVFIIATTIFSATPAMVNAQRNGGGPKKCHRCSGRCCVNGYCSWGCYNAPSNAIFFQLEEAQNVSLRIYDITGRLVKIVANKTMSQVEHQIEWNKTDEAGNTISGGIYILR